MNSAAIGLDLSETNALFTQDTGHLLVQLAPLQDASVLWINDRVFNRDPCAAHILMPTDYKRHILENCAYSTMEPNASSLSSSKGSWGVVDRYGGAGIGNNGGSGRAAVINGYNVKGIGRTALSSPRASQSHSTGNSSIGAAVREVIYSEIVAAHFPNSAIPILAVVAVNADAPSSEPFAEQRALIVRPNFVRAAHFERAVGFISHDPKEGAKDRTRLDRFFSAYMQLFGKNEVFSRYESFWSNWSRQLAYSFVHRMPHGANTTSNISFDGRLLDFGSMSAVQSWANIGTMLKPLPFDSHFSVLEKAFESLSYYFARYVDRRYGSGDYIGQLLMETKCEYRRTICREALRVFGVPQNLAVLHTMGNEYTRYWGAIHKYISSIQNNTTGLLGLAADEYVKHAPSDLWALTRPKILNPLWDLIDGLGLPAREAQLRSELACERRSSLGREELRQELVNSLERIRGAGNDVFEEIAQLVRQHTETFALDKG